MSFNKLNRNWRAQIQKAGATRYIGSYTSELEAAHAYDEESYCLYGARVNFPETAPVLEFPAPINSPEITPAEEKLAA